jgi:hypothetical protein
LHFRTPQAVQFAIQNPIVRFWTYHFEILLSNDLNALKSELTLNFKSILANLWRVVNCVSAAGLHVVRAHQIFSLTWGSEAIVRERKSLLLAKHKIIKLNN